MRESVIRKRTGTKAKAYAGKARADRSEVRPAVEAIGELEGRIALIQALIPLGLRAVEETLEAEVRALAGERYRRHGGQAQLNRWGSQPGSVYLADQKVPIEVPRVRDTRSGGRDPAGVLRAIATAPESG